MGGRQKSGRGRAAYRPKKNQLLVNGYSAQWLGKGFPWVYAKEVMSKGVQEGNWATAVDNHGKVLGWGLVDTGWISLRVLSTTGPVDETVLHRRLDAALQLRTATLDSNTDAWRLVHGENDGLPGLRINWWSHYADVVLDSPAMAPLLDWVCNWLEEHLKPRGIRLCYRQDPRDDRAMENPTPAPGWIRGRPPAGAVRVMERSLLFDIDLGDGPDVGLYTDMRSVRAWLEPFWGGRRVLNTFAYTGAFSVAAAKWGASSVVTVDLSSAYLDRAEQNFRANQLDPGAFDFIQSDVFKAMDRLRRTGQRFDLIILDPPSFSHSSEGIWSVKKDYPRLAASAFRLLEDGGWVLAASNQGDLSPRDFRGFVQEGAKKAGCLCQEIWWAGQGPDFPAATWFPEGRYLKVGVYRKWVS